MQTHRGAVISNNGMVASGHPLASWAGADILSKGGNAMDAAIATASVSNVVLPHLCGLGGDAFILYYDADKNKVTEFNGSGVAPYGAHRDWFIERGYKKMPLDGILSVSVPGQVSALCSAGQFANYPLLELLSHAITYAEKGFPISKRASDMIFKNAARLRKNKDSKKIFFKNGKPLKAGDILIQKDLAKTFRKIGERGKDTFYKGEIFEKIMRFSNRQGGLFEGGEWTNHETEMHEPLISTYKGHKIIETSPPSQGYLVLEGLNILEKFNIQDSLSAEAIHYMVEIKRRIFSNRLKYLGEPFDKKLIDVLISKNHAEIESKKINLNEISKHDIARSMPAFFEDTTYFSVVDKKGNAVSWIHSLSEDFGCGVIPEGTGVLLNNRAGRGFNLIENHPNVIASGKKTMHTLNCWMVFKNNALKWVGGTPGGDGQPQWNMQLLSHLIDKGMNPQQSVEAPRWLHFPGTDPETINQPFSLYMEDKFEKSTIQKLEKKGQPVKLIKNWYEENLGGHGGNAQIIEINQTNGSLIGGSDFREDGTTIGI